MYSDLLFVPSNLPGRILTLPGFRLQFQLQGMSDVPQVRTLTLTVCRHSFAHRDISATGCFIPHLQRGKFLSVTVVNMPNIGNYSSSR